MKKQENKIFHDYIITKIKAFENAQGEIPERITFIEFNDNSYKDTLFINQIPVPRWAWSYDKHDKILRWEGLFGGGQIHIQHTEKGGVGVVGKVGQEISVRASARAQFLCDVALNCGVSYVTSGDAVTDLLWDPTSPQWENADWVKNRLLLTYTVTQGSPIDPPSFTFEYEDKETNSSPWDPSLGSFQANLQLDQGKENMVWDLVFKSQVKPPADLGINPATGPDTVYPFWLHAQEDTAASSINGAMEIDDIAPKGTLVGIRGNRVQPQIIGYYQTQVTSAPFGIFDGKIHVDGEVISDSKLEGGRLKWQNLAPHHQEILGLPAKGWVNFNHKGGVARFHKDNKIAFKRLSWRKAIQQLKLHKDLHQNVNAKLSEQENQLADPAPTIQGLLPMTPFRQNTEGAWGDAVQTAVREDLSEIMNSFVDPNIWKLLFPGVPKPTLTGRLAEVANSPVQGVADPQEWYKSLGTAVMTQGMANSSDSNSKNMNGPRAAVWLKQEVANSAVYQAHSQLLFQYHWEDLYPTIADYLTDQSENEASYEPIVDNKTQSSIADINQNVQVDPSSPPDLKEKLIQQVQEAGQYAKTNKLFWAFAFYNYNTAPAILANIAIQMGVSTGNADGTALSRMFQQNITVLTSLDPSGYFAKQYNQTINTFLSTNILPSMYGFNGDNSSFSLIKEYLQAFVNQNINNENESVAQSAAQIQEILDQENSDEIIQNSIEAIQTFSDAISETLALPYIANQFENWFPETYPTLAKTANVFGTVLIGGLTGLATFSLILEYKSWDELSDGERAEIITNTVQLGLQLVSAVVQRGVRVYAVFGAEGMTAMQRAGAVGKILFSGEADGLEDGLLKISNNMARWVGDTEGSLEIEAIAAVRIAGEVDEATASLTAEVFGRNLDEFIATRIGPVFILAGIGFSIYSAVTGDGGIALGVDILNIASGSLSLFAIAGTWAIEGGFLAADGIMAGIVAVAGPLAIVAALAGVGLMLYELFKKKPDPIKEFVDDYVRPAGFYVASKCSSIDYAIPYALNDDSKLLMVGFTLAVNNQTLIVNPDEAISLGEATNLPNCVWSVQTDGVGMSQIFALINQGEDKGLAVMLLSLMSDNTISFQPKITNNNSVGDEVPVQTQTWLSTPRSNAQTTNNDTDLASLNLSFQPVFPDKDGNYNPQQARGGMVLGNNGVQYSATSTGDVLTLTMVGMAPNYMKMSDLSFLQGSIPSAQQSFGPSFGINPSTPLSFDLSPALPPFLDFVKETGKIKPNGGTADTPMQTAYTITVSNKLGTRSTSFTIKVS